MGHPSEAPLVKPICGLLLTEPTIPVKFLDELTGILGPVQHCSELRKWEFSRYYAREMGEPLWRAFVIFGELRSAGEVVEWKLATNQLEQRWACQGRRRINADPGYVSLGNVVLVSTKNAAHRIYLGQGIFGEVTLLFQSGTFRALPTTYPDYAQPDVYQLLLDARKHLLTQFRNRQ